MKDKNKTVFLKERKIKRQEEKKKLSTSVTRIKTAKRTTSWNTLMREKKKHQKVDVQGLCS